MQKLILQLIGLKHLLVKLKRVLFIHGKIKRIAEFGIFVELVPGQDGLVHISTIDQEIYKRILNKNTLLIQRYCKGT